MKNSIVIEIFMSTFLSTWVLFRGGVCGLVPKAFTLEIRDTAMDTQAIQMWILDYMQWQTMLTVGV